MAALAVLAMHVGTMTGTYAVNGAYLAVDFFFVLSGFVIGSAYDQRLREGMSFGAFLRVRIIRLWPLIILALLIGCAYQLPRALAGRGDLGAGDVALSTALSVFLLPSPPSTSELKHLYPANFAFWSLFFEVAANLVYAVLAPWLTVRRLSVIVACGLAAVIGCAIVTGELSGGADWSSAYVGLARVTFGFFAGLLLYRLHDGREVRSDLLVLGAAALLAAGLCLRSRGQLDLLIVLLAPALVWFAASIEPSRSTRAITVWLGRVSYPAYVLHLPVSWWMLFVLHSVTTTTPWLEQAIAMVAALIVSTLAAALWDEPIRKRLKDWRSFRAAPSPSLGQSK